MTVDELELEIRALSADERAQLLARLGLPEGHRLSRIFPDIFDDRVRIDDSSSEYQQQPQIAIQHKSSVLIC